MTLNVILLAVLVLSAVMTVMSFRLLWAAIGLATVSSVVTILMFMLGAPLAAVFELSVCAGLIPAILVSAISLTRRLDAEKMAERRKEKFRRFIFLPVILIVVGLLLTGLHIADLPKVEAGTSDVRNVLWHLRQIDLVGQIAILLGGALAVEVLLKELKRD